MKMKINKRNTKDYGGYLGSDLVANIELELARQVAQRRVEDGRGDRQDHEVTLTSHNHEHRYME